MSFLTTIERKVEGGGGAPVTAREEFTTDAVIALDISVAADAANDFPVTVAIDVTAVKAFYMLSPDSGLTIETNSGSAADDTITLVAGKPYVWTVNDYDAFLLGTDVTMLYITNTGDQATTLYIRVAIDATP